MFKHCCCKQLVRTVIVVINHRLLYGAALMKVKCFGCGTFHYIIMVLCHTNDSSDLFSELRI